MPPRTLNANRERLYTPLGARGSRPSHQGQVERTYDELYEEAKRRNIKGRSKMSKTELERALGGR
jgi:hypothetical protein